MRRVLVLLAGVAASACASSGAVPRPFPVPGGAATVSPGRPSAGEPGYAIAGTALSFRGAPYKLAGSGPSGFDCSGLVWYVFRQHGVQVPRTVAEQYRVGSHIETRDLRAGDLVFFNTSGASPSHVGISIGGDEFVHAPAGSGQVRVERLAASYWKGRFVGARRIL